METFNYCYTLRFPDGRQEVFDLHLDAHTLDLIGDLPEELPYWTRLNFHVDIITPERIVFKGTTAQKGISSLMGLIMATSGCPQTSFFKPMARFHLPFASAEETIYRASSMYLLAQYFLQKQGAEADLELKGLAKIYHNIQLINYAMAKRLRAISDKDSALNALVLLDIFAKTLPSAIEDSLEEVRYLFKPYLTQ